MKLTPPDPEARIHEAAQLMLALMQRGWVRPNRERRLGLSVPLALGVLKGAHAPHEVAATGRWSKRRAGPDVELWMPAWCARVFETWHGRTTPKLTLHMATLAADDELRAAWAALDQLGQKDAAKALVRRVEAAQAKRIALEAGQEVLVEEWQTELMIRGFYVVCERERTHGANGTVDVWTRSGAQHTTKQDANTAARALMERVGYNAVAMLDRNGQVMKLPRPRVRAQKEQ